MGARTRDFRDFRHIAARNFAEFRGPIGRGIVTDQGGGNAGAYALELTGDARRTTSQKPRRRPMDHSILSPLAARVSAVFAELRDLPAATLERLASHGVYRKAPAGTVLFSRQTPCVGFPLLLAGSVREMVTRLLRSFEDRGWVALGRENIVVRDRAAISGLAHG